MLLFWSNSFRLSEIDWRTLFISVDLFLLLPRWKIEHISNFAFGFALANMTAKSLTYVFNLVSKVKLYAKHFGKTPEQIEADIRRPKYFSPSEAVEYGIIDKVPTVKKDFSLNLIFMPYWIHLPLTFCRYCILKKARKTMELFLTWRRPSWFNCRKTRTGGFL